MRATSILVPGLVAAAAAAGSVTLASASVAQPRQPGHITLASTYLAGRPDSGGLGNWATDSMYRQLIITETGTVTGGYAYTATVRDIGTFRTGPGAYTPDQGAPYTGDKIRGQVSGRLEGDASYSFTASALPSTRQNAGVPDCEYGAAVTTAETTNGWYEQAFPAGTTFGGAGIGNWSWTYAGPVCTTHLTVGGRPQTAERTVRTQERWTDSLAGGGGQLPADGNITGSC